MDMALASATLAPAGATLAPAGAVTYHQTVESRLATSSTGRV